MRIVAIGDIHGRDLWRKICTQEENSDKIVFIGDYLDSYDGSGYFSQLENLKEIIHLKSDFPDRIILLMGNHDYHYLPSTYENYSGFQAFHKKDFGPVVQDAINRNLIQACFIHSNWIFSHAGITKTWCDLHKIDLKNLQNSINSKLKESPNIFSFHGMDPHGEDVTQSPIWVRPSSLFKDKLDGYKFVVGHTQQSRVVISPDGTMILIDNHGFNTEYLVIDNDEISINRI